MGSLTSALDLLDLAVASSGGLASEAGRKEAATVAAAARKRHDFFSDSIVVAIAGGTGSGKSSLLNALAGQEIASTSPIRPHTNTPLAWIPEGEPAIATLVRDLGIDDVVEHDNGPGLAIIDLPDLDSVNDDHRAMVEAVLPRVDAVLWVFDPVKYHDPSIHADFLTHLVAYEPVFTFVLNKIDRLDEAETEAVATHLGVILSMDGYRDAAVVSVAAAPPGGDPIGIDSLRVVLNETLVAKRADRAKLIEDLLQSGRRLASETDAWSGTSDDAANRVREALDDPEQLVGVLEDLAIDGPLREGIVEANGDAGLVDRLLLQRAELAATVAALGVSCAEISHEQPGVPT